MIGAGYAGLFLSAFLAATILPFYSEAALVALGLADGFEGWLLIVVATAGNTLGALVNWCLGRFCIRWRDRSWFPVKPRQLDRATAWFNRYGVWTLLLAWLPVGGDPLTFVAGMLRVNVWLFLLLVGIGKAGRYIVLLAAARGLFG